MNHDDPGAARKFLSTIVKGSVCVLAFSLFATYIWMYLDERSEKPDYDNLPDVANLRAGYEKEKAAIENLISHANNALSELDSVPRTELWPVNTEICYRQIAVISDPEDPNGLFPAPIEIERVLDQDCIEKQREFAKKVAETREREINERRFEIEKSKAEFSDALVGLDLNFNANRRKIIVDAKRQISSGFISKFSIIFSLALVGLATVFFIRIRRET